MHQKQHYRKQRRIAFRILREKQLVLISPKQINALKEGLIPCDLYIYSTFEADSYFCFDVLFNKHIPLTGAMEDWLYATTKEEYNRVFPLKPKT